MVVPEFKGRNYIHSNMKDAKNEDAFIVRTELEGHESALRELLREYFAEADERALDWFEDELSGIDVAEAVQSDIDRLATAEVDEPLFLARVGGRTVGCVQLKRLDATTAEVKRLYVAPTYRGEGLGRRLVEALLDGAADDGFTTLRLGVAPYLEKARSMYRDLGFEFTPPYEQSQAPEEIHDEWRFMRLSLDEG